MVENVVSSDIKHLASNTHEKAIEDREKFLKSAFEKVKILRLGNLWNSWKLVLKKQLQLKWNMRHFPSAPPVLTTDEQLNSLSNGIRLEGDNIRIGNAKLTARRIDDIAQAEWNVTKAVYEAEKRFFDLEQRFYSPVSLVNFIGSHLTKACKKDHIYCKIILAHPEMDSKLTQWLVQKLSIGEVDEKFNTQRVSKILLVYLLSYITNEFFFSSSRVKF